MEAWRLDGYLHDHRQRQNFANLNVYQLLVGTGLSRRHMSATCALTKATYFEHVIWLETKLKRKVTDITM